MNKALIPFTMLLLGIGIQLSYSQITIVLQPGPDDGKDAYTSFLAGTTNTGDHQSLVAHAWTNGGIPGKARSFLAFDLASIPTNATVISAALSLFHNPTDNTQSFDYHTGDNEFYIQRIINSWHENSITWNNQPNTTGANQVTVPPSSSPTQDYLDIDVTEIVKDMIDSPMGNHGLMIRMVDEINYYRCVLYASSDHSNADLHPKLVVSFKIEDEDLLATASAGFDVDLCYNSSFTLSGTATNGTISWLTSGDGTFTNETTTTPTYTFGSDDISNGNVTLTLIVSGAYNSASDEMIITIKPEATAEAGEDDSTYFDIPYHLSGSATDGTISWSTSGNGVFTNENGSTPTYTFGEEDIVAGKVTLTIKVVGSCNIPTDDVVLSLISKDFNVYLYPNPASEYAIIEISQEAEFSLELFNSLGQLVMDMPSIQSKATFDVSGYATGNYLIRITNSEFLFTKKLTIHRDF